MRFQQDAADALRLNRIIGVMMKKTAAVFQIEMCCITFQLVLF